MKKPKATKVPMKVDNDVVTMTGSGFWSLFWILLIVGAAFGAGVFWAFTPSEETTISVAESRAMLAMQQLEHDKSDCKYIAEKLHQRQYSFRKNRYGGYTCDLFEIDQAWATNEFNLAALANVVWLKIATDDHARKEEAKKLHPQVPDPNKKPKANP